MILLDNGDVDWSRGARPVDFALSHCCIGGPLLHAKESQELLFWKDKRSMAVERRGKGG